MLQSYLRWSKNIYMRSFQSILFELNIEVASGIVSIVSINCFSIGRNCIIYQHLQYYLQVKVNLYVTKKQKDSIK